MVRLRRRSQRPGRQGQSTIDVLSGFACAVRSCTGLVLIQHAQTLLVRREAFFPRRSVGRGACVLSRDGGFTCCLLRGNAVTGPRLPRAQRSVVVVWISFSGALHSGQVGNEGYHGGKFSCCMYEVHSFSSVVVFSSWYSRLVVVVLRSSWWRRTFPRGLGRRMCNSSS